MISFKNNTKKSTSSLKVIVICMLLSGSLITPGFANGATIVPCTTGSFTINSNVVTGNTSCAGEAIIPDSVTSIGNNAFAGLTGLTSVTIGNSVTSIGSSAFYGNTALTSVTIGNSVTSIGSDAFGGNTRLTSVTIPDSVITIGADAFYGNTTLTSVIIGNSVTSIGSGAFQDNVSLISVTIGNSVTSIGNSAFSDDIALRSVTIPDSVLTIGNDAFRNNTALTSVTIGNSVTSIGNSAFYGNTVLRSVTIPDSVTSIGAGAFLLSNLLASVTFLGIAALTDDVVGDVAFSGVAVGAIANVAYNATGFPPEGDNWKGLIVRYASAPPVDADSSSSKTDVTITPTVVKTADASFKLTNRNYLSKYAMKTKLSMNRSFKRNPEDLYKYSIFKSSKKSCGMRGNYVMRYENSKTCDLYITRTNAKGISNKYWIKINYTK